MESFRACISFCVVSFTILSSSIMVVMEGRLQSWSLSRFVNRGQLVFLRLRNEQIWVVVCCKIARRQAWSLIMSVSNTCQLSTLLSRGGGRNSCYIYMGGAVFPAKGWDIAFVKNVHINIC